MEEKTEEQEEEQLEKGPEQVRVGDISLSSYIYNANQLAFILCELLKSKEIKEYLGTHEKNRLLGRGPKYID